MVADQAKAPSDCSHDCPVELPGFSHLFSARKKETSV